MLSCININTFLMQVICCPMSLFAFTVDHSRFQQPKNCFLSSELELGHASSSLAVVQNSPPKELQKKRVVLWLLLNEEHFSVPNLHINLTYPPFYIAKHCIWPLLVKKVQDAVFYSLHFLSLFMSLWLSAFTSIVIQLIKMVNVCNQVSKYFYPDSILKLL